MTDSGIIQRVEYTFISFLEIEEDWVNWPTPETKESILMERDVVNTLFSVKERPQVFYPESRPA